jgi:hemerythrin-like domain-containing protein
MAKGDSAELNYTDVNTLLRFLKIFADEHHHLKEESALRN